MSKAEPAPTHLVIPQQRRPSWRNRAVAAMAVGAVAIGLVVAVARPSRVWSKTPPAVETLEIDQGDVSLVLTENGVLESASNSTVRCEVEALVGTTGGQAGAGQGNRGAAGSQGTAGGGAQGGAAAAPAPAAAKSAGAATKAGAAQAGGTKAKVTGAGVASKSPTPAPAAGAAAGAGAAGGTAAGTTTGMKRPDIRSFNYIVEPHIPLRGAAPKPLATNQAANKQQANAGSNGGRGGGGRGGSNGQTEMPGSTRIIEIIPEGSRVKAGDIVCELDSSAFREELQAQEIRYIQAKSWVEQARSILEVNEIALREYEQGVYPQDIQLINQYIAGCRTEQQRARLNLNWSRETAKKGYRASAQVKADELADQQATFVLSEAEGMKHRLKNYTMPRIMKARLAKIEAIKADLSSQEASFELESQRLKQLKLMIEKCTLRAPRDGIIVYANQTNSWGRTEAQIQEGVTVRQTQPIFYLPDPKHMQVKARINESKTSMLHSGQRAIIRIDAFPDRPLTGTVAELTAIPAPASIANLDVKIYYATIGIDSGGFDELRPGLSTEVNLLVETRRNVTRIPLRAIQWVENVPYAAIARKTPAGTVWDWTQLKLGLTDLTYAEVINGLKPGDRVSANPSSIPPPSSQSIAKRSPKEKDTTGPKTAS